MKEFIIRGQTAHAKSHTINFSGHKGDYGFYLTEFKVWPSTSVAGSTDEQLASITAAKTASDPQNPNFDDEGLIGNAMFVSAGDPAVTPGTLSLINDTFIITQDLLILVRDESGGNSVNWQCKFMPVKLSTTEAALTNYRQFSIFDE